MTGQKNKTKVAVQGATGQMGREVVRLAQANEQFVFAGTMGRPDGDAAGTVKAGDLSAKEVDVLIDFSQPEAFAAALRWCLDNKKPLVSGTTGLSEEHKQATREAAKVIPILWAPNMSFGVAVMNRVLRSLPKLEGFDFAIEETHHRRKKDKPSGTALELKQSLEANLGHAIDTPVSIRGGGVFGIHKVHLLAEEETLCFEHTALNRTVFARGALLAAKWIHSQESGLYSMADVIG